MDNSTTHHYPEKKRRRIFEREGAEFKLQRGLGNLSGTRDLLTARTLGLSIARRFDEPLVSDLLVTCSPLRRSDCGYCYWAGVPVLPATGF